MKTVIIGDSHVNALAKGLALLDEADKARFTARFGHPQIKMLQPGAKFLKPFHKVVPGGIQLTSTEAVAATVGIFEGGVITPEDGRELLICCGFHGVWLNSSALWKQYTINPKRQHDRQFVSGAAFSEMVKNISKDVFAFLTDLKKAGIAFKVISSPPLPMNYYHTDPPRPFTEDECWSIDERYKAVFAAGLEDRGIEFILPPSDAYDGRLLKASLSWGPAGDHHSNSSYGKMYLAALAA